MQDVDCFLPPWLEVCTSWACFGRNNKVCPLELRWCRFLLLCVSCEKQQLWPRSWPDFYPFFFRNVCEKSLKNLSFSWVRYLKKDWRKTAVTAQVQDFTQDISLSRADLGKTQEKPSEDGYAVVINSWALSNTRVSCSFKKNVHLERRDKCGRQNHTIRTPIRVQTDEHTDTAVPGGPCCLLWKSAQQSHD